jgi:hypothetical protein
MKIQKMATANNEEQRGNCRRKLININSEQHPSQSHLMDGYG